MTRPRRVIRHAEPTADLRRAHARREAAAAAAFVLGILAIVLVLPLYAPTAP